MTRFPLLVVAMLAVLAAGCGDDGSGEASVSVADDLVAVVGDREITVEELDRQIELRVKAAESTDEKLPKAGTQAYRDQVVQPLVDRLVTNAQVEAIAEELGIEVTDEDVNKALDEAITQQYGGDRAKYEADLEKFGFTEEEVKSLVIRASLLQEKIQEKLMAENEVNDDDVRKYYDDNVEQFVSQDSRVVDFLLVGSREDAIAARADLASGAEWSKVAKEYAIPPGPPSTGGKFQATDQQGAIEENFRKAVFGGMANGQLSALIPVSKEYQQSSLSGQCKPDCFFLVRPRADVVDGKQQTFADVESQIRAQLEQTDQAAAVQKRIEALLKKQDATTFYNPAYEPPETTPPPGTDGGTTP